VSSEILSLPRKGTKGHEELRAELIGELVDWSHGFTLIYTDCFNHELTRIYTNGARILATEGTRLRRGYGGRAENAEIIRL